MKTAKYLIIIIGCLIANSFLVSCNDEDNYSSEGSAPQINGRYLTKINSEELEYNSQGQLVRIKVDNMLETTFSYEPKRIIVKPYDMVYYLRDGLVTECRYNVILSDIDDALTIETKDVYEYNKQGYLIKEIRPIDFTVDYVEYQTTVYEWTNGNISKITSSSDSFDSETIITYTSLENNIPNISNGTFVKNTLNSYLSWQGYFGRRPKNLPDKEKTSYHYQFDDTTEEITYRYEYTVKDGVVANITSNWYDNGRQFTRNYVLEWW